MHDAKAQTTLLRGGIGTRLYVIHSVAHEFAAIVRLHHHLCGSVASSVVFKKQQHDCWTIFGVAFVQQ